MQGTHTTQAGQFQGSSCSGQGVGHGHLRQGELHQQGPGITSGQKHLQSSQKGSHKPTQKQTNQPT